MTDLPAAIRRAMGLMTQKELARRCGVSPVTISLWLHGKRRPSLEAMKVLSTVTGVSLVRLVEAATRQATAPLVERDTDRIVSRKKAGAR